MSDGAWPTQGGPRDLALAADNGAPTRLVTVRQSFRAIAKEAGAPLIALHDLRSLYATLARDAGADMAAIALLLGQAELSPRRIRDRHVTWARQRMAAAVAGRAILGACRSASPPGA